MKIVLIFFFIIFFSSTLYSQVGINTQEPTESLDVNGTLRIRKTQSLSSNSEPWVLVSSESGVVKKVSSDVFSAVTKTDTLKVVFNDTVIVPIPTGFKNFGLDLISTNGCGRTLFASLRYALNECLFIGASALGGASSSSDAKVTTDAIGGSEASYGAGIKLVWNSSVAFNCPSFNSAGIYLYNFWIRRTSENAISFVWGDTGQKVANPDSTDFQFIFTKY